MLPPILMENNLTPFLLLRISNPASPSAFSVDDPASHFIKKTEATRRGVTSPHHVYSSPAPAPTGVSFPSDAVDTPSSTSKATLVLVPWTSPPLTLLLSLGHQFLPLCWNISTNIMPDTEYRHPTSRVKGGRGRKRKGGDKRCGGVGAQAA